MTTYEERKLLKWEKLRIIEKKIMNQIYLDIEQLKDDDDEFPESIRLVKKFKLEHAKQDMKNISRLGFFTIWTICALITE